MRPATPRSLLSRFPTRVGARALLLTGLAALTAVASARAHVEARPPSLRSGEAQVLALSVPNERADSAMTRLEVSAPAGVGLERASAPPGWRARADGSHASWEGVLPAGTTVSLSLTARADLDPGPTALVALQRFADGASISWNVPLTILPPADPSPGMRLGRAAVGAVAGAAVLAASLLVLRVRRRPTNPP